MGRLVGIDAARGVAAIVVMVRHCSPEISKFVPLGHLAVDLFFMLSGFVLASAYHPRFADGLGPVRYFGIRLVRLYPMLALGGTLGLAGYLAGYSFFEPADRSDFWLALSGQFLLVPFAGQLAYAFAFNPVQWSIAYELAANVLHCAAFRWLTGARLVALVGASGAVASWFAWDFGTLDLGWQDDQLAAGLARACFGFFAGVLLFRAAPAMDRHFAGAAPWTAPLLILFVAIDPFEWSALSANKAAYELVATFVMLPVIALLAAGARAGAAGAALGVLSYPLYAVHYPVLAALRVSDASIAAQFAACAALICASYLIGRWIEEPLMALRRRAAKAVKARPALAA